MKKSKTRRQAEEKKSWYQELEDSRRHEKKMVSRTRRQPRKEKKTGIKSFTKKLDSIRTRRQSSEKEWFPEN